MHILDKLSPPVLAAEPGFAFESYFGVDTTDTGLHLGGTLPPLEMDGFLGGTEDVFGDVGLSQKNPELGFSTDIELWPHFPTTASTVEQPSQMASLDLGSPWSQIPPLRDEFDMHTHSSNIASLESPVAALSASPTEMRSKRPLSADSGSVYNTPAPKKHRASAPTSPESSTDGENGGRSSGTNVDSSESEERRAASNASARARRSQEAGFVDTFRACLDLDPTMKRTDVFKCVLNALSHRVTLKIDLANERKTVKRLEEENKALKRWMEMRETWWRECM